MYIFFAYYDFFLISVCMFMLEIKTNNNKVIVRDKMWKSL